jgi:hypothetical protein
MSQQPEPARPGKKLSLDWWAVLTALALVALVLLLVPNVIPAIGW